ncbi:DoxX family protein [Herpetosiphon llansteffanensis]|uniref:DoxX family protein n=1 Tax=Herpetosiphon llansteffanensis TaxID=2094568 RepID=UPI000D7C3132|nr:DoxX family protein [Herpetosiphon llansteffanensis]
MKRLVRGLLASFMLGVGVLHFTNPKPFVEIVPPSLPRPRSLVYLSGVFEILGGLGLLLPGVRRKAGLGLMALYLAVFPANIQMLRQNAPLFGKQRPFLLWLRLPFQPLLIWLAWWVSRDED